jgi:hypothetical protein
VALLLPTTSRATCKGDCDNSGSVSSADLALSVDIVLGKELALDCPSLDFDLDGVVTAQDMVAAIKANVEAGCAVAVHVSGQVKNDQGNPVQGAEITVGAENASSVQAIQASMARGIHLPGMPKLPGMAPLLSQRLALTATVQGTTDQDGNFALDLDPIELPSGIVVDVSFQQGTDPTVDSSRTVSASSANVDAGLITIPTPSLGKFTPVGGAGATNDGDVDVEGLPGDVTSFYANALDPDANTDAFPGDFSEVGKLPLNSSGFQWLEAQDANGNPVDSLANAAIIRGKLEDTQWPDLVDLQEGTDRVEVPLYTFNEATAMWEQDGTGWLEDEAGTVLPEDVEPLILQGLFPGKIFVAYPTEHLSWFNVDYPYIGPWSLARLDTPHRNIDCLFLALQLARRIAFSQIGVDAFAAVNQDGADILQELADGRGPSIVAVDLGGRAHGAYRGDAGGSESRIELAETFWTGCALAQTEDDRRTVTLLMAAAILHETAHWKDDLKKFPSNNGQEDLEHDTPGEEGEALERAIFGGVLDIGLDGHAIMDGVPVPAAQRDAWLNPGNWPPATVMEGHALARTLPPSPITVTIATDATVFDLGEPIPVHVTYENVSNAPVKVMNAIQLEGHPLYFDVLREPDGARMPFLGPEYKLVETDLQFTTLQPGGTLTLTTDLVVGQDGLHYGLEGAKTYDVTAFYEPHRAVELTTSNTLILTIGEGASLGGHVNAAETGNPLPGATVIVRRDGVELTRAFTNQNGDYLFEQVPPGVVSVEARADGYLHVTQEGVTLTAGSLTTQNFTLSSLLAEGQIQFVLSWGDQPEDLDSHLWLPADRPFHVAYYEQGTTEGCPFAELDNDETNGLGPETITIDHLIGHGIYRYAVHNYSDEVALKDAATRPTVRIVRIGHADIVVVAPTSGDGEWWHVVDVDSVSGDITLFNEIGVSEPSLYPDTTSGCPAEQCSDFVDNDEDGFVDCADPDCATECNEAFKCYDGYDNDLDGLIDCADSDCFYFCDETFGNHCADLVDNDHDGLLDCRDPDCVSSTACDESQNCSDCYDNDHDGLADCEDPDCAALSPCASETNCYDYHDNDLDGLVDCADPDCQPCTEVCYTPADDDRDGLINCLDPDCASDGSCVETACDNCADDDADTVADCADSDCAGAPNCTEGGHCYDGFDNDGDTLLDCADPDCSCECARCGVGGPDPDADGIATSCDNCPTISNANQYDFDGDGVGNRCDPETCGDGIDNDGDGWYDCFDPDCTSDATCNESLHCHDFLDNDFDCTYDCADSDCFGDPDCFATETGLCLDYQDNDQDGLADCADADCFSESACQESQNCADGIDNDHDGHVDCLDTDCPRTDTDADGTPDCDDNCPTVANPPQFDEDDDGFGDACDLCPFDYNSSQFDCDGDGRPADCDNCPLVSNADQADSDENGYGDACDEACSDGQDNDGDGCADGADSWCGGFEIVCDDGVDNDCDGLLDTADPECGGPDPCIDPGPGG